MQVRVCDRNDHTMYEKDTLYLQRYFQSHIVVRIPSRQTIAPSDYTV